MQKNKKILIFRTIIVFLVCIIFNSIDAYNIEYKGRAIENFNGPTSDSNYPALLYRTFTAAAESTKTKYNDGGFTNKSNKWVSLTKVDDWVYFTGNYATENNKSWMVFRRDVSGNLINPDAWPTDTTFRTWSEFYHPHPNTYYDIKGSSNKKYYTMYTSDFGGGDPLTATPYELSEISKTSDYVTNITSESTEYVGLYTGPSYAGFNQGIIPDDDSRGANGRLFREYLNDDQTFYRMKVQNKSTFVADNIVLPNRLRDLIQLYGPLLRSEGRDYIYTSSNAYTNNRSGMDTAYKFYNTLYNYKKDNDYPWRYSTTFSGGSGGIDSFINIYDNKLYLPKLVDTMIYVRHIDISGMEVLSAETITDRAYNNQYNIGDSGFVTVGNDKKIITDPMNDYVDLSESAYVSAEELTSSSIIKVYNKLHSEETKKGYGDTKDYSEYQLVNSNMGIGENIYEASSNMRVNYESKIASPIIQPVIEITSGSFGKTIMIDFLYKKIEPPKVYIRHVDITGLNDDDITSQKITDIAYEKANSLEGRYIKNVGFANNTSKNKKVLETPMPDGKAFEIYILREEDSRENTRYYNKLYDDNTRKSTGAVIKDSTSYVDYMKGSSPSYLKTVVAEGNTYMEAAANRDAKIDSKNLSQNSYVDVSHDTYKGKYVYIDFYYKKKPQEQTPPCRILVRHINVSGMTNGDYKVINNMMQNGTLGSEVFKGEGKITSGSSKIEISSGRFAYPTNSSNYYNELYELEESNISTTWRINNNFYTNKSNDYKYIGYIVSKSNYALDIPELLRDQKINKANFSSPYYGLDGLAGDGYVSINTKGLSYVVVDMYYSDNTAPIKLPDVKGRLEYNTTNTMFQANVNSKEYDYIPSGEYLYGKITDANKHMLGGIRVVEKAIDKKQQVSITVNQEYTYKYEYWSSVTCSEGHPNQPTSSYGTTCNHEISAAEYDEKGNKIKDAVDCSFKLNTKNYTVSGAVDGDYTKTIAYEIPFIQKYYKISNMRMYKITHMEIFDQPNTTDLSLFEGNTYEMRTTNSYNTGWNGTFSGSSSSQVLGDTRENLVTINTSTNSKDNTTTLSETVTLPSMDFGTLNYKSYTSSTALTNATSYVDKKIESIKDKITNKTAHTIISSNTSGGITEVENDGGAKLVFTASNDNISMGSDTIVDANTTTKTVTIKKYLEDYEKDKVKNEKIFNQTGYPSNIIKNYAFNRNNGPSTTTLSDFDTVQLKIPENRLNGERISIAKIHYEILEDSAVNFDVSDISKAHDWTINSSTLSGSFLDTEMNKDTEKLTRIVPGGNLTRYRIYDYKSSKGSTNHGTGDVVNVFTPIKFSVSLTNNGTSEDPGTINHSEDIDLSSNTGIIQKETRFTVTMKPLGTHENYSSLSKSKMLGYIGEYYIKFDNFDVQDIYINDKLYQFGSSITAGKWIGPIANLGDNTKISAIAKDNPNNASSVLNQDKNGYTVIGVSRTATYTMKADLLRNSFTNIDNNEYENIAYNRYRGSSNKINHRSYNDKTNLYSDYYYMAQTKQQETRNLNRIYDFKITDVKDIDWKEIFRKSTSTTTNVHSGNVYYSGVNKWNIYSTNLNDMVRRTVDEIGATGQKTLPVGPYKNTNTTYTYAPKLGYRFSFDFKTTGMINTSLGSNAKKSTIEVSYCFIKKGENINSIDRLINDVDLYYKDSYNKYVKIDNDTYPLYMVPNDGYRLTFVEGTYNFKYSLLSKKTVGLGTLKKLNLNSSMRALSDNEYIQIWYGEYKLPNSTIAVEKGTTNLNEALKDGYIGVKFKISVTDKYSNNSNDNVNIYYGANNKSAPLSDRENTSQWDYEGFLGLKTPGKAVTSTNPVSLRIGKNVTWTITDNNIYNNIKGLVILYDADARAASDYS